MGKSISERPKEIRSRDTFGHWELDTVVSGRGKNKGCVATFIERKTRLYTAIQMPDRTALSMEIAFGIAASQYPVGVFQTATADRGKEFACYDFCKIALSLINFASKIHKAYAYGQMGGNSSFSFFLSS